MYLFLKIQGIFEVFSWWWLSWHILKKVAVCVWDVFLLDDPRCFWGIFFIILHILKVVAVGAWDVFLLDDPRYFRTIGKYFPADGPRNRNLLFATKDILYFLSPTFFSSKPCLFSYFLPSHWLHIKTDDDDSIILATVFSTHTAGPSISIFSTEIFGSKHFLQNFPHLCQ